MSVVEPGSYGKNVVAVGLGAFLRGVVRSKVSEKLLDRAHTLADVVCLNMTLDLTDGDGVRPLALNLPVVVLP